MRTTDEQRRRKHEKFAEIERLWKTGISDSEIGDAVGMTRKAVRYHTKKLHEKRVSTAREDKSKES